MKKIEKEYQERLFELQDMEYQAFHSKLIPNVSPEKVIGVRTPMLRKLAKELTKEDGWQEFMDCLPHSYYEENNLHGFFIETIKDYDRCIEELNRFLPYVDNWGTCDLISPKVFQKHLPELREQILVWLESKDTYVVRFGMGMLLKYFLDSAFEPDDLALVAGKACEEYYINMMIAWYLATALAKQWESTVLLLEEKKLPVWIHNKTIQKAVESRRITEEQKEYLRSLRMKKG